jgi:thiol-disulfide isomerase/thioredoxin
MLTSNRPAAIAPLAFAICLAISGGCEQQPVRSLQPQSPVSSDAVDVKLLEGDRDTYAQILSSHDGKVILVDFWATWCGPCVKQFPHSIELSRKHRDAGLAVVTVSMNEPKERDSVLAFLTRQNADVVNLLPRYGAGSEFLEAFDLRGDVPFYKLYDRKGTLRYTFSDDPEGIDNCEPIEQIDRRVEELLLDNS